jgi:DNA-binding LacI/PurR family transcriptional regulator
MQLPHYEMGRWATRQLLELIAQPQRPPQAASPAAVQQKLACPLIERQSA